MPPTLEHSTLAAPPDYAETILGELERDVATLVSQIEKSINGWSDEGWRWNESNDPVLSLNIGYWIASHRGRDIIKDNDVICGLSVKIVRHGLRTITVSTNKTRAQKDGWFDENEDWQDGEQTWLSTSMSIQW